MNAVEHLAPVIPDALSWPQICGQYPDQWVCVVDIQWDEPRSFHFRSARVIGHGTTRRAPLVQARPWRARYAEIGHFFTGKIIAPPPRPFT
jgi:hypothetical protein